MFRPICNLIVQNSKIFATRSNPAKLITNQLKNVSIRTLASHTHHHNHVNTHILPEAAIRSAVSRDDVRDFMAVWPDIVRDLNDYAKKFEPHDAPKWLTKCLQYNVPNGKKNRGLVLVQAFKTLAKEAELSEENLRLAQCLGWCVEMLQAVFVIDDDIMDGSKTRRGQKCWYTLNEVGLGAINDAIMIENGIYHLLQKYFSDKDYYRDLVDLFHDVTFITALGQFQDIKTTSLDLNLFTMERYKSIVANKTSYYSFYLPVAAAMHMSGYKDPEVFRQAKTILMEVGNFFQVQDDFIDCFGDPSVTGKIGTDIQDGKCSWLAVVALQRCNNEQKDIMRECYGKNEPEMVERVKELYEDLMLPHTYEIYEEESYNIINTHIQQISRGLPHKLFFKILEKIYKRNA